MDYCTRSWANFHKFSKIL